MDKTFTVKDLMDFILSDLIANGLDDGYFPSFGDALDFVVDFAAIVGGEVDRAVVRQAWMEHWGEIK